ncbi:ABC transporter permease [Candidatus Bathyarchaeota archaeon]|nr:ABC transporter permease [Candidatus Bathyarchaeota archaeon]
MTVTQKAARTRPSWFTRFWAIVRYEMLWNIRKKKFIGIIIIAFVLATLGLALPPILSSTTGIAITSNPNFAITYGATSFGFFLFALATAMNSISSEFENGTVVPLLTKPVSRTMVFLGKLFAAFVIILVSYVIIFTYTTIGSIFVYGPQNNLQLVPLVLLGNLISTFIWVSILLAMGSLTKSTILTALVALGLFLALFIALPFVSLFAGPSASLNYFPGSGASGSVVIDNTTMSISTGTDNLGVNLVNYALYPSATVEFSKIDIQAIQAGQTTLPTTEVLYTEPISLVAFRALGVAFAYILVFLFIAWIALKRSQVLE